MGNSSFIPSLTPLRGIASILVVFFHFHIMIGQLTPQNNFVISKLYLMVDLFFVLSGFIMAHVYGDFFVVKIQKRSFIKFMKARFARLYPLHLFTFLYVFFLTLYLKSQIDFNQAPTIFQNILDNTAIPGVLTLTHAWGTHLRPTNTIDIITGFALLRGFCSFIFGMLTYEFYTRKLFKKILEKGFWFPLVWVLLFLCWINDILLDPFAILIFSVLILHASYADGLLKKLLNNRVFTYLGDISYSIYMVHIPIIITLFIVSLINGEMATPPCADISDLWLNISNWRCSPAIIQDEVFTYHIVNTP